MTVDAPKLTDTEVPMSLLASETAKIVKDYQLGKSDTGSPEVQVAILSARITQLTGHLKTHKSDYHSQRGLIRMVNQRRKLLDYLARVDINRYRKLIDKLGLRS